MCGATCPILAYRRSGEQKSGVSMVGLRLGVLHGSGGTQDGRGGGGILYVGGGICKCPPPSG